MARRLTAPRRRRTTKSETAFIPAYAMFGYPTGRTSEEPLGDWSQDFLSRIDRDSVLEFGGDARLVCLLSWGEGRFWRAPTVERGGLAYFPVERAKLSAKVAAAMQEFEEHRPDLIDDDLRAAAVRAMEQQA